MRIAVLNYSGNVGKTTIARDLFFYRMLDYELLTIESVNSDGKENLIIRGEDGDKLYTEIILNDDLILDIGSSNLESFFRSGQKEAEILNSIDRFVIPVTPEKKQQFDTLKTIKDLLNSSVNPKNIYIIMNQVMDDPMAPHREVFEKVIVGASAAEVKINLDNIIFRHDLYTHGQTLAEMMCDTDYKSKMEEAKAAGDKNSAREFATKFVRQKKLQNLDQSYQAIMTRILQ